MKCPKCRFANPNEMQFCGKCGAKLETICPTCGFANPNGFVYCGKCGGALAEPKESHPIDITQPQTYTPKYLADKILTTRSSIEGERKLVTVLFADVAAYTSMAEKLDPEEVHQIMDGCFKILMDEIHRYEGTINQFTGDGVMALFGAPVAHEDHAQRACYAALSIQKATRGYGENIKKDTGMDFRMRIGLNSGPVIVGSIGDDLRMDYTAVGDTTNIAARIQQITKPGQVWVSEETHSIIRDYFQDELVEETSLKGKAQPQRIYHILSERADVSTRFQAGIVRGITDLVGRRPEMEVLKGAFQRAKEGEGQVVDVVGEAGVGKSRLVYEFQRMFEEELIFLTGNCVQFGRNINFLPVIDVVKEAFGIKEGMSEEEVANRIEKKATKDLLYMIPFYRNLLALKVDDPKFKSLEAEGRKFGTFEAIKSLLLTLSGKKALVVFLDDVHWIDKISEAFFTYFARCITDQPILMLAAYRPEGAPTWIQGAHYQRLGLETLSAKSSIKLVRTMLHVPALEPELEVRIVDKTEGNPLFVEEIVRELLDRGDLVKSGDQYLCKRPIDQCEIPNTIQGVLAARMDRLSEDLKRTMQVASVIGRDFAFKLLKSIMDIGDELRSQMTNLVGLEILYEKALYPELEYIFKHALTQEVAYDSLLKQRRREIHGRIARTIEDLYAERIEEHYESLAHHFEQSGNSEKALDYLIFAGEKSNHIGAVQAAHEFFKKALEVSEKTHIKIDNERKARLYLEQAEAELIIGAIGDSVESSKKAIALGRRHAMSDYERKGLGLLAINMRTWPLRKESEKTLEKGLARAREMKDKGLESIIMTMKAHVAGNSRHRYDANQMLLDAEEMALASENPQSLFHVRYARLMYERLFGNPRKAVELSEGMSESVRSVYNISILSSLNFFRGIAFAEIGEIEEGMAILRNGIDICEKFGAHFFLGALYNSLGYCYGEICQPERAWKFNQKGAEIAHQLIEKFPMGRLQYAHTLAESKANLVENLLDQRNFDEAWKRIKGIEQETKGESFDWNRYQWESRVDYYASQILLNRSSLDEAETIIQESLKKVRTDLMKKREGSFMCLLGGVQTKRNESNSAITNLNKAIQILKEVENPRQLWQAHCALASTFDRMGRRSEAKDQWGAASDIIKKTSERISDRELQEDFINADPIREILSKAMS